MDNALASKRKQLHFYNKYCEGVIQEEALSRSRINKRRLETIIPLAKIEKQQKILDLGCGNGFSSIFLAKRGHKLISVDLSSRMIKLARKKVAENGFSGYVNFIVGDVENLPIKSGIFDASLCIALLHHVPNDLRVISEMKRVLRMKGKIAISEPNALNPYILIKGIFHILLRTPEHMILRSIKWRFTKIFKKMSLDGICSKNVIFTPRGTDRNVINYFANVEEKLEKMPLFNNVSACFVVVGEKS